MSVQIPSDAIILPRNCGWELCLKHRYSDRETKHATLSHAAKSWNSCAIGECLGFPDISTYHINSALQDHSPELYAIGQEFYSRVRNQDYDGALETLAKINDGSHDYDLDHVSDYLGLPPVDDLHACKEAESS